MANEVNYESMLVTTYGTGTYQIICTILYSMTSFMYAMDLQSMIFMHYQPSFTCSNPELDQALKIQWLPTNLDITAESNLTIPNSTNQCWALIWYHANQTNPSRFICTQWTYDNSTMVTTVVTQFDLVCDSEYWIPIFESAVLFCNSIGFLLSSITDLVGRRYPFLILCGLEFLINWLTALAWSPISFLVMRCLHGLTAGIPYVGMILATELVPQNKRALYGTLYWINFSLGYMICAGLAYWIKNWSHLRLWICVFHLSYLTYPYFVSDTPRWLGLNRQTRQVINLIKRLTKWNQIQLETDYLNQVEHFLQTKDIQIRAKLEDRFSDLFFNSKLRKRTLALAIVHTGLAMVYFGLITDGQFASQNIFLNVFLLGLVETPANFVGWKCADLVGRRRSTSALLGLSCLAVIGAGSLKTLHPFVQCSFAILGKFLLTVGYCVADLYIIELYPTSLRTRGMLVIVTLAGIGSALSPYVNQLHTKWTYLPYLVYGGLCGLSSTLVYFCLPETKNQPLIQTVEHF